MSTKKSLPSNIRTGPSSAAVLVSPISVAHRNRNLEDGMNNPVRAQWVANLKKRAEGSPPTEHKTIVKINPVRCHQSVRVEPKATATSHIDILPKKLIKPLLKKRPNCPTVLELQAGKPRTPRRKLNSGQAFDEIHIQTTQALLDGCYPGVGTPSAHHTQHILHPNSSEMFDPMFGHGIDMCSFDTFLDLPTPKSTEIPTFPMIETHDFEQYHAPPTLVRQSSVEQDGLSLCFEQTHLSNQVYQHPPIVPPSPFGSCFKAPRNVSNALPSLNECLFDHNKHPELENIFDFNEADIEKEVDNFYLEEGNNELEIDLIST
ncbi:hypothetical protein THRCLA_20402 [Thraustotheca clavata]|uniref:Uncharacterized protein n=1 Tax=Thraustotheca clavata TaxID=74557 RepID=A0A1W0A809_9STRA|nr:hypothetical protein THRCLA_20402 [Thraustotheca clavata]